MIDTRRKEHEHDIEVHWYTGRAFSFSLSWKGNTGTHACTHTAQCRATKRNSQQRIILERFFQLLKSLQRRSVERISRVSKRSLCLLRPEGKKKDIETGDETAKRLCSCFLSQVLCFLGCDFSRFFYERAYTRGCIRGVQDERESFRPGARRVLPLRRAQNVNGRNLYDPRKQIIGAILTSRSTTLGRIPTSAF